MFRDYCWALGVPIKYIYFKDGGTLSFSRLYFIILLELGNTLRLLYLLEETIVLYSGFSSDMVSWAYVFSWQLVCEKSSTSLKKLYAFIFPADFSITDSAVWLRPRRYNTYCRFLSRSTSRWAWEASCLEVFFCEERYREIRYLMFSSVQWVISFSFSRFNSSIVYSVLKISA